MSEICRKKDVRYDYPETCKNCALIVDEGSEKQVLDHFTTESDRYCVVMVREAFIPFKTYVVYVKHCLLTYYGLPFPPLILPNLTMPQFTVKCYIVRTFFPRDTI